MSVFCADEVLPFRPLFLPSRAAGISDEAAALAADLWDTLGPENARALNREERAGELLIRALDRGEASVSADTFQSALAFLWSLPSDFPLPDVLVEDDGQFGFDWDLGPAQVLSVNVGGTGMLGYSALIGAESTYGRAPFAGTIPESVARLLVQVVRNPC